MFFFLCLSCLRLNFNVKLLYAILKKNKNKKKIIFYAFRKINLMIINDLILSFIFNLFLTSRVNPFNFYFILANSNRDQRKVKEKKNYDLQEFYKS